MPYYPPPSGGNPGGEDGNIQYNSGGFVFGGDSGLNYNNTSQIVTVTGTAPTLRFVNSGTIANYYFNATNLVFDKPIQVSSTTTGQSTINQGLVVNQGGGGTANDNFVVKSALADNTFYVNSSSGRVGIGTTAPTVALEVIGSIQMTGTNLVLVSRSIGTVYPLSGGDTLDQDILLSIDTIFLASTNQFILTTSAGTTIGSSLVIQPGSSMTHHITGSNYYLNAITSTYAGSAGLAGLAELYVVSSASPQLTNSRILTAGSSITIVTDGTAIYISALTNAAAGVDSAGLAGTGLYYLTTSAESTAPNSLVIVPGSSVTHHITGSNYYINATTSAASTSAGLASIGNYYITSSLNSVLSNALVLQAGSSSTIHVDGSNMYINSITSTYAGSAGLAGNDRYYLMTSADATMQQGLVIVPGSSVTHHITGSNYYINALTNGVTVGTYLENLQLYPQSAKLYFNTSAARIDAGSSLWRLLFSPTTQQYGIWQFCSPNDYNGSPYVKIYWGMDSGIAVAASCSWIVDQWGWNPGMANTSMYIDTYGGANIVTVALSAGFSAGNIQVLTVPLVTTVSMNRNTLIKLRISGSGSPGNLCMVGAMFGYIEGT